MDAKLALDSYLCGAEVVWDVDSWRSLVIFNNAKVTQWTLFGHFCLSILPYNITGWKPQIKLHIGYFTAKVNTIINRIISHIPSVVILMCLSQFNIWVISEVGDTLRHRALIWTFLVDHGGVYKSWESTYDIIELVVPTFKLRSKRLLINTCPFLFLLNMVHRLLYQFHWWRMTRYFISKCFCISCLKHKFWIIPTTRSIIHWRNICYVLGCGFGVDALFYCWFGFYCVRLHSSSNRTRSIRFIITSQSNIWVSI